MAIDIPPLLAPISADAPCGQDASFSDLFDRIREARRADDTSLSQGEWQTEIKVADWRQALDLSAQALTRLSKDLQAAAWLTEALVARHGLDGARDGFALTAGLLEQYWDSLYPELEGDDSEERASRLVWLDKNIAAALWRIPLNTDPAQPASLLDWQSSREVDNLARQNNDAYQEALGQGRMTGEAFDALIAGMGDDALRTQLAHAATAQTAFVHLKSIADNRFGRHAPGLGEIDNALKRIQQVLKNTARAKGLLEEPATGAADAQAPGATDAGHAGSASVGSSASFSLNLGSDSRAAKQAALRALTEIAEFFRRTEPHSPVTPLLEQAVRWADMPLADFLSEVLSDSSALDSVRARIGLPR